MDRWLRSVALVVLLAAGVVRGAEGVRERLVRVTRESEGLRGKGVESAAAERMGYEAVVPEDRGAVAVPARRFARASEVAAYVRGRPWSVVYGDWGAAGAAEWPMGEEGAALRELLKDGDGKVRSLAVEALGALDEPGDVGRIGGMLEDGAAGAVVLGWSRPQSAQAWVTFEKNPVVPERTWAEGRTVGTYAREALRVMTGHRFDGEDPRGVTFGEWWKTHDQGRGSLWYWQERLRREERMREGRGREAMHRETVKEIAGLPADAQWKVFLLATASDGDGVDVTGAVNPLLPEGIRLEMGAGRLKELIAGELVRADLAGEWGYLEKVFREERCGPGEWGSDARTGILKALGEGPHTKEKARRLAELIDDPRNAGLFTQANERMGMDMYRYWAMRSVEGIAGRKVVPEEVEEGFKDPARAGWALEKLRELAREVAEGAADPG